MRYILQWGCLLVSLAGNCQESAKAYAKLQKLLLSADSVILVGHENTGLEIIDSKTGRTLPNQSIVTHGQINHAIIVDKVKLSSQETQYLADIIAVKYEPKTITMSRCFFPNHSILIFTQQKISYIDICFGCHRIQHSSDIRLADHEFDQYRWEQLKRFFKSSGITHEIE